MLESLAHLLETSPGEILDHCTHQGPVRGDVNSSTNWLLQHQLIHLMKTPLVDQIKFRHNLNVAGISSLEEFARSKYSNEGTVSVVEGSMLCGADGVFSTGERYPE